MRLSNEIVLSIFMLLSLSSAVVRPAAAAPISIHFDKDVYIVSGPGETIDAQVLIDGNPLTLPDDPIRGGLYSDAVRVDFNAAKAQFTGPGDVTVPPLMDHFGFSAGAFRDLTANFAGIKGNIDQHANPPVPYASSLLATFRITNLASGPDSYPLLLDFFRTLGANEQMFLDGNGNVLDADIQFVPSRVVVIPEPATGALVVSVFLFVLPAFRSRRS